MPLRVVGAGLSRTGTASLKLALEALLGEPCFHMSAITGHPFDLGPDWRPAIAGGGPPWAEMTPGCAAAVDWPASLFWRQLSSDYPQAVIVLGTRPAAAWLASLEATILPYARQSAAGDWTQGRDLVSLFSLFTGTDSWDDANTLLDAYGRCEAGVRADAEPDRLVKWNAAQGWEPLCAALGLAVPDAPFPWVNRRQEWS
ncbi:MAG: sulfotransferase family protein [Acidimicrobiales bacterium]